MSIVNTGRVHTEMRLELGAHSAAVDDVASSALLSMMLDLTTDGVLLADDHGVIVYVNQPLLQLFGYNATDLLGKNIDILVPEGHREHHHQHVARFLHAPEPRPMGRDDLDIEGRRADGSIVSIDVQLNALPDSSLVVATVRDMTAQRRTAVDGAIAKIDLANATTQINHLQDALDLVIQRLFALGTSITASASNQPVLLERLAGAVHRIDEIIDTVQQQRHTSAP